MPGVEFEAQAFVHVLLNNTQPITYEFPVRRRWCWSISKAAFCLASDCSTEFAMPIKWTSVLSGLDGGCVVQGSVQATLPYTTFPQPNWLQTWSSNGLVTRAQLVLGHLTDIAYYANHSIKADRAGIAVAFDDTVAGWSRRFWKIKLTRDEVCCGRCSPELPLNGQRRLTCALRLVVVPLSLPWSRRIGSLIWRCPDFSMNCSGGGNSLARPSCANRVGSVGSHSTSSSGRWISASLISSCRRRTEATRVCRPFCVSYRESSATPPPCAWGDGIGTVRHGDQPTMLPLLLVGVSQSRRAAPRWPWSAVPKLGDQPRTLAPARAPVRTAVPRCLETTGAEQSHASSCDHPIDVSHERSFEGGARHPI